MKAGRASRRGIVPALVGLALLAGLPAGADWRDILPVPFQNNIYLDLYGFYEQDHIRYGPVDSTWNDTFFREKVTLASSGYFYHPRFLQYQSSFSEALKQEYYEITTLPSQGWRRGNAFEYDVRLLLLPEHFYNLELFALRYEPLLREQSASQRNGMQSSYGAFFRYRRKPWFGHFRFSDDTVDSGATTTEARRVNAGGEYFRRFKGGNQFSLAVNFNPNDFSTSQGLEGEARQRALSGTLDVKRVRLSASASRDTIDQSSPFSGDVHSDDGSEYFLLTTYLPAKLRADVSYRKQDSQNSIRSPLENEPRQFDDRYNEFRLNLVHRLYDSLDTTYVLLKDSRESTGGDSGLLSSQLNLSYSKSIQPGRVLAGLSVGRSDTENTGKADVVNEAHPGTAVPGRITLGRPNADPASIVVFLKSPLPPNELVPLVENVHYIVAAVGNTFEIQLLTLPPEFAVPGTFDFEVTYSLVAGHFELRTDGTGYNLSVELLDRLFTPYYGYAAVRSKVLSGDFPGVPVDSTSHTVGLMVQKGGIRGTAEYQELDWDVSPYTAWREELQYIATLDPTMNLYAVASVLNKHFPQGASPYDPVPYTDRVVTATCNVQKKFDRRNMSLSAGATYSNFRGLVESDSYSLNSTLVWRVGKLDLNAGLSAYSADSSSATTSTSRRDHGLVFIKARRSF